MIDVTLAAVLTLAQVPPMPEPHRFEPEVFGQKHCVVFEAKLQPGTPAFERIVVETTAGTVTVTVYRRVHDAPDTITVVDWPAGTVPTALEMTLEEGDTGIICFGSVGM